MSLSRVRRSIAALFALACLAGCTDSAAPLQATSGPAAPGSNASANWVGTWSSGVRDNGSGTGNVTYRLWTHNAVGGKAVRLRFSNRYGKEALTIRSVSISMNASLPKTPAVDAATVTPVRFGGAGEALIPAGGELRSDPVSFALPDDSDLAITFHVPDEVSNVTGKGLSLTTSWSNGAGGGDATGDTSGATLPMYEYGWPFLTGIEVDAPGATTVVALGDSITDGAFEVPDADTRWPDLLADRIKASDLAGKRSVVNVGISGNMVTADRDGNASQGQAAITRMAWDVFALPNLSHIIVFEGINDIGVGVSGPAIIDGVRAVIAEAHRRGIKVIVSTLTPCFGNTSDTLAYTMNEAQRQPFNDWVLHSGEPDAVINFNAAVRAPLAAPDTWLPALTVDFLHPNPAGLMVMANAIPLDVLR